LEKQIRDLSFERDIWNSTSYSLGLKLIEGILILNVDKFLDMYDMNGDFVGDISMVIAPKIVLISLFRDSPKLNILRFFNNFIFSIVQNLPERVKISRDDPLLHFLDILAVKRMIELKRVPKY